MTKRPLARALSAAVITAVVSAGALVGGTTSAGAEPEAAPAAVEPAQQQLLGLDLGLLEKVLTAPPQLLGTGDVGDPLSLVEPVFGLLSPVLQSLVTTDITWLCDGVAIPGVGNVTRFVPTEAQAGCQLAAQTVSSLLGLLPLSLVTDIIPIPGGVAGAPRATTAASISGTPEVGQTLAVTDPVWDTADVTNTYAWVRNGTPIAGATAPTYQVTAQDAGKQITARVTGTKAGKSGASVSNPLTISTETVEQLVATAAPRISGTPRTGGVLSIDPGTWLGGLVSPLFEYQWYSSAGPIRGATSREYVPTLAEAGRPVAATVTARLPGFLDGLGITNVVRVPTAGTRTRLARAGARLVALRVTPAKAHPTGTVRLLQGGKVVRTVRLQAADNGRRTVRLPRLVRGTHRLRAVYLGSRTLTRSSSTTLRLRVR